MTATDIANLKAALAIRAAALASGLRDDYTINGVTWKHADLVADVERLTRLLNAQEPAILSQRHVVR